MSAGARALVQVLGRNQGPTKVDRGVIANSVLANGLRRNSRVKSLRPFLSRIPEGGNRQILEIACVLRENKSLVDLGLMDDFRMSDGRCLRFSQDTFDTRGLASLFNTGVWRGCIGGAQVQSTGTCFWTC
jgi:hypothetical protein